MNKRKTMLANIEKTDNLNALNWRHKALKSYILRFLR